MDAQHAVRLIVVADDDAHATDHIVVVEERWTIEPSFGTEVLDNNRLTG